MKVLLIEDEGPITEFLKKGLEAEFFVVDVAEDGESGSRRARMNDYDFIILDNILPKKTGLEVCEEIRRRGKNVPIIVLSVKSEPEIKIKFLRAGADDYLSKPFSLEELVERIRAILRRPKQIESEMLAIDDLVLDTKKYTVCRAGKKIKLTRKEFMLLEYLLRNKGSVLSRSMIMDHVWDMDADPFSNTIEYHILSLRHKINFPGKQKLIKTVSGRGYKIDDEEGNL